MNTVSSQVTMFTDPSVPGVCEPGPSLHQWASFVAVMGSMEGYDEAVVTEAARLGPDSYASRALHGSYLEWVFHRVTAAIPAGLDIQVHQTRAVTLQEDLRGRQCVVLEDGTRLGGLDAVVLALGHLPVSPTREENELAAFAVKSGLTYIPPASPADVELSAIEPREPVLLRGLGLNFFDYISMLTVGRGGSFERDGAGLVYRPSGLEPRLYAGSRRGIPYHSRGRNQKGAHGRHIPVVLTDSVLDRLRSRGEVDFRGELWPLIAKEVETVYYTAVLRERAVCDCRVQGFVERYLAVGWQHPGEQSLLDEMDITPEERWNWHELAHPYGAGRFTGRAEFHAWLLSYLRQDVAHALAGNVSDPRKAALDVLRDLRNEVRLVVDHGRLTSRSHREDLQRWYTPFNAFLSIGPPVERIEEIVALIRAGVLDILGPGVQFCTESGSPACFVASSPLVAGPAVCATTMIEARLPDTDLARTVDPLLQDLLAAGQCRPFRIGSYQTGGMEVTERPGRLVDAAGRPHPRRFAYGIPTESVHWGTAAGARPGVNSVLFGDSDAIARAVLNLTDQPPVHRSLSDESLGEQLVDI
jgi:hypothetical protein